MADLSSLDWTIVEAFNEGLPLAPRPFAEVARRAGCSEDEVLARLRAWRDEGVIRRFGARVGHRRLGYRANGMSVWAVPPCGVERVAEAMVRQPEVSHCYERPAFDDWPYSLYAMIHGASEEEVRAVAGRIAEETGCRDYEVLFSAKEYKKTRPFFSRPEPGPGQE